MRATVTPQDSPVQHRPWLPTGDGSFAYDAAHREGWTVSEAEPEGQAVCGIQLQRLDNLEHSQPVFADDRDAWKHVVSRAREGSSLHRQALEMIDDVERFLIEAADGAW